ncbi:LysR family transcriptional regulator [Achromobacter sp. Marseille-Q0513]|uniref:LysR family transcriptional regulator n=1 Tax=Achromobacter sp. Marseille-Q0513 TaxID=2829161 RepID=UPI001B998887|nr:LysR family transcriptional regulator [Achromobacter sp. Marseille-Q0513]MBR8654627.1 LysR family transcriptional regulator [Achromobacter sp. Marseille-Q0513]
MDPFSDISTFVRAAEAGNFTRAARVLQLSPSAVSKAVARLEAELGVRLFHRSPRQITLTGDGESFFEACRQGMTAIEDARGMLSGGPQPWRGKLRICIPVSFGQYVAAPALGAWLDAHPGLDIELMLTDRHVDMTAERYDLAVMLGEVPDSRLVARPLPPHRFLTVAAPAYLRRRGAPETPDALGGHDCLRYVMANSGQFRPWTFARDGQQYRHFPAGPVASDHAAALLALAESGRGILQAPRYVVAQALDAGRLVPVLNGYDSIGAPLAVVYEKARHGSPRNRLAAEFLLGLGSAL